MKNTRKGKIEVKNQTPSNSKNKVSPKIKQSPKETRSGPFQDRAETLRTSRNTKAVQVHWKRMKIKTRMSSPPDLSLGTSPFNNINQVIHRRSKQRTKESRGKRKSARELIETRSLERETFV